MKKGIGLLVLLISALAVPAGAATSYVPVPKIRGLFGGQEIRVSVLNRGEFPRQFQVIVHESVISSGQVRHHQVQPILVTPRATRALILGLPYDHSDDLGDAAVLELRHPPQLVVSAELVTGENGQRTRSLALPVLASTRSSAADGSAWFADLLRFPGYTWDLLLLPISARPSRCLVSAISPDGGLLGTFSETAASGGTWLAHETLFGYVDLPNFSLQVSCDRPFIAVAAQEDAESGGLSIFVP